MNYRAIAFYPIIIPLVIILFSLTVLGDLFLFIGSLLHALSTVNTPSKLKPLIEWLKDGWK